MPQRSSLFQVPRGENAILTAGALKAYLRTIDEKGDKSAVVYDQLRQLIEEDKVDFRVKDILADSIIKHADQIAKHNVSGTIELLMYALSYARSEEAKESASTLIVKLAYHNDIGDVMLASLALNAVCSNRDHHSPVFTQAADGIKYYTRDLLDPLALYILANTCLHAKPETDLAESLSKGFFKRLYDYSYDDNLRAMNILRRTETLSEFVLMPNTVILIRDVANFAGFFETRRQISRTLSSAISPDPAIKAPKQPPINLLFMGELQDALVNGLDELAISNLDAAIKILTKTSAYLKTDNPFSVKLTDKLKFFKNAQEARKQETPTPHTPSDKSWWQRLVGRNRHVHHD